MTLQLIVHKPTVAKENDFAPSGSEASRFI